MVSAAFFGNERYVWVISLLYWITSYWFDNSPLLFGLLILAIFLTVFYQSFYDSVNKYSKTEPFAREFGKYLQIHWFMAFIFFVTPFFNLYTLFAMFQNRASSIDAHIFYYVFLTGWLYIIVGIYRVLTKKKIKEIKEGMFN